MWEYDFLLIFVCPFVNMGIHVENYPPPPLFYCNVIYHSISLTIFILLGAH